MSHRTPRKNLQAKRPQSASTHHDRERRGIADFDFPGSALIGREWFQLNALGSTADYTAPPRLRPLSTCSARSRSPRIEDDGTLARCLRSRALHGRSSRVCEKPRPTLRFVRPRPRGDARLQRESSVHVPVCRRHRTISKLTNRTTCRRTGAGVVHEHAAPRVSTGAAHGIINVGIASAVRRPCHRLTRRAGLHLQAEHERPAREPLST